MYAKRFCFAIIIIALLFVLIEYNVHSSDKNSIITFKGKTFGGEDYDEGNEILQSSDGGYILLGTTKSFGAGDADMYLVKTDKNGKEKWSKTYGGKDYDEGNSIIQTSDGGYLILGTTKSFGAGMSDMYLVKTNPLGHLDWEKTYGTKTSEHGNVVLEATDGGYLIFGSFLIKVDKNGDELWKKAPEGLSISEGYSMAPTSDGGYILIGIKKTNSFSRKQLNLVKIDSEGNKESGWPKTLLMISGDHGSKVTQISDKGYLLVGGTASLDPGKRNIFFMKTDEKGKKLWTKSIGGGKYDTGNAIIQLPSGGVALLGLSQSSTSGKADVYLVKTSAVGHVLWEKAYGGSGYDRGNSIVMTSDGGFALFGSTESSGAGKSDMYFIKTDADGNVK
ncbi:hypothetical protein ACFL2A_00175 [Thermodesulfobacteriota bacterium]